MLNKKPLCLLLSNNTLEGNYWDYSIFAACPSCWILSRCRTVFPYESEAQLEHLPGVAVRVARAQAGQQLWLYAGDRRVDVNGRQHPVALAQQAVEHQQRQGRLRRVGVDDDVTEGAQILQMSVS